MITNGDTRIPQQLVVLAPELESHVAAFRDAVLNPEDDLGLPSALRWGVAAHIAGWLGDEELAAMYRRVCSVSKDAGFIPEEFPKDLEEILAAYAGKVTNAPRSISRGDIDDLVQAGLNTPQVVALSELIAFVNFECRIRMGLGTMDTMHG